MEKTMNKTYQKKHELWLSITFASFAINDEEIFIIAESINSFNTENTVIPFLIKTFHEKVLSL